MSQATTGQSMRAVAPRDDATFKSSATDDPSSGTVKMSKVMMVEVKGTPLSSFSAMGPSAATWKPVDGRQAAIFGTDDMTIDDPGGQMKLNADLSTAVNSLKNVTITKVSPSSSLLCRSQESYKEDSL